MKVTVITPCHRPEDRDNIHANFERQDYEDKTLIVINTPGTIGAKRNRACELATSDIIIHFDSDDYYAPSFISKSVKHLIDTGAQITGLSSAFFYRPHSRAWLYEYKGKQPYVIGSGMCYWRSVWEKKPFRDINCGEDLYFQTDVGKIVPHDNIMLFMAMIHDNNTASHKQLGSMKPVDPSIALSILGESYYLYG